MARMLTNGLNAKLRLSGWFCRPDFSLQAFERIEKGQYSIISSSCVIHSTADKMENLRRRNLRHKFSVTILWLKDVFIEWFYTRRSGSMFSWWLGVLAEFGFILSEARFTKLKQALRNYFIVLVFYHSDWFRGWVCICVVPNLIDSTFVMRLVSFRLDECYGYLVTLYWAATNRPLNVMLQFLSPTA